MRVIDSRSHPSTRYQAYLLRMWQDSANDTLRFSLENATTRELYGFPDLETLISFLQRLAGDTVNQNPPENNGFNRE